MSENVLTILYIGIIAAVVIAIYLLVEYKPLNVNKASLRNREINRLFNKYCMNKTYHEFRQNGKAFYTQKGKIRSDALKICNARWEPLANVFFTSEGLREDFKQFITDNYKLPLVRNLPKMFFAYEAYRENELRVSNANNAISVDEFFIKRNFMRGDVVGVYVLHNLDRDMYYVGQAKRLYFRVNQHFTGHGNGDVYADYKYGQRFSIILIPLNGSGYSDLDYLERVMIQRYNAYNRGYNKTMGNC